MELVAEITLEGTFAAATSALRVAALDLNRDNNKTDQTNKIKERQRH